MLRWYNQLQCRPQIPNRSRYPGRCRSRVVLTIAALLLGSTTLAVSPQSTAQPSPDATHEQIEKRFSSEVQPLLQQFCLECHRGQDAEAMLDLSKYEQPQQVARDHQTWAELRERVHAGEMPPEDAKQKLSQSERDAIVKWVDQFRKSEAERHSGDPGLVPVRRLSNSEMNYAIRDLTGVDIRPTKEFPVDPANEAGFDNSSQSLTMSPALFNKALAAARFVAEHMVLTMDGFDFAPHPAVTDTDRDKYCVKRVVDFYKKQPTDLAPYFYVAWQHHRAQTERSLTERANEAKISPKYLATIYNLLTREDKQLPENAALGEQGPGDPNGAEQSAGLGPLAVIRTMWLRFPANVSDSQEAQSKSNHLRDFVIDLRNRLKPEVQDIKMQGIHVGAQPFVLWKNGQYASYRQRPFPDAISKLSAGAPSFAVAAALTPPENEASRKEFLSEVSRFCRIFPDAFYISERGRDYVDKKNADQERGRLLSAGFHSMMGYYRDDEPLMKLILNNSQRAEIDRLWQELDFVTSAPMRQYAGFLWFERTDSATIRDPEFDFARAEDKSATSPQMIERLASVYSAKAERLGASEVALDAIEQYYIRINQQIQWVEKARILAEPHHINALVEFANQAYRRDLTDTERAELRGFYDRLRIVDQLTHEEAVQDVLVSILLSPEFSYRVDLASQSPGRKPLSDDDLASRLSFFLWSSIPDQELRELARDRRLHEPDVLRSQVRRMISDPRIRALATEFGGQWLDFRRFEEHNSVDRERFTNFTDPLRTAMFEEPIRFLEHIIRKDRSVLECLNADYLIVNQPLATHYGISKDDFLKSMDSDGWALLPSSSGQQRGGLTTMAVFLTQNSPGRRTSPVKRGYWVVRRLLGEHIPPPPANVPELPSDEAQLGTKTLRETLAMHREHKACAGCHNRFDSIGLVFENFGPVGELREVDLAGNRVDTRATFPNGEEGQGIAGLKNYLEKHRQRDFVDNLVRKLLTFALGRTLMLSDEPLVEKLKVDLAVNDYRFASLIETIVLSPQFLEKRGTAALAKE